MRCEYRARVQLFRRYLGDRQDVTVMYEGEIQLRILEVVASYK